MQLYIFCFPRAFDVRKIFDEAAGCIRPCRAEEKWRGFALRALQIAKESISRKAKPFPEVDAVIDRFFRIGDRDLDVIDRIFS